MEKKKLNVLMGVLASCIVVVAIVLGVRLIGQSSDSGTEGNGGVGKDAAISGDSTYIEPVTEIEIPDDGMYSIEVKTEGDMFFEGIGAYIYTDNTMEELVWFDKTDENGIAEFTAEDATGYVVVLQDIPEGYNIQEYYYITGAKTEIILGTALKEGVDLSAIEYSLGDVIHDFTVTAPDGTTYTVSEILEEKKAIILNFWYVQCGPCKEEFPHMNEAYAEYKDKIEILAMNPVNLDDEEIAKYIKDMGIKFPMMQCEEEWATAMGITAYPTTVVIDRYGVISLMHRGSLPDTEIFKQLFEFYSADDYKQTVVEDIYDIVSAQLSEGTMDNPFEMGGILDFEITIRPEQVIYFNMYRVDQMNVRIADEDAYAIYEERTYYPENGVVGFKVSCPDTYTPAFVGIGNAGTEKKTFHVTLGADLGTYENPYTLKLGEFSTSISAGNDQGVFYEYRATKTGSLEIQCLSVKPNIKYSYYLQNMRTSENRNLEYDSKTDSEGNVIVAVNVEKGDRILLCISTLPDSSGNYPAGNFKMKASLGNSMAKDKQYYGVSVVDDNLKPITGATVKLTCLEIEQIEGVDDSENEDAMKVGDVVSLVTDAKGAAARKIRIGSYEAVVTVPAGYTADTTKYIVTKDNPDIAIMLNAKQIHKVPYTIKVVDSKGNPIAGAGVTIGEGVAEGTTDSKGCFTANIAEGNAYKVFVAKLGYISQTKQLAANETTLTVTLKIDENASVDKVPYTVAVKYMGTPAAGMSEKVTIHFKKDGASVAQVETTLSKDKVEDIVTVQLPKGNYVVSVEYESPTLGCYSSDLILTEDKRNVIVETDVAIGGGKGEVADIYVVEEGDPPAYYIYQGANPIVNMQDGLNYFVFVPKESGMYRISAQNTSATLTYWGGSTNFIIEQTESLGGDYSNNSVVRSVSKNNIGSNGGGVSFIFALEGDTTATLLVERIGEAESEIPTTVYSESKPPKKAYSYTGATLPYFDVTADNYKLVKGSDGYYRLNGNLVYVDLDYTVLSMTTLVEKTGFKRYFDTNGDGKYDKIEDYTPLLADYVKYRHEASGYYPLTDALMYMIKNGGEQQGWWDSTSANYQFAGKDINVDIAWLFFCCSAGL